MKKSSIAIAIVGYGKMGRVLEQAAQESGVGVAAVVGKTPDADVYAELSAIDAPFDCLIDFSHHSNLEKILQYAFTHQKPLVICTTGFNAPQEAQIRTAAKKLPVVFSQNMSVGVNVMLSAVRHMSAA
ncbi:MAG: hypothetical protein LBB31_00970, partial [Prevotellaceae bacterium]|nr:hypothetical protein [Prevotellaceae bacterium]